MTFSVQDMKYIHAYHVDAMKQSAIMKGLAEIDGVRRGAGRAFVFVDNAAHLNANGRRFRFYELSGFFRKTFGDQSRLGIIPTDCSRLRSYSQFTGMMYNIDGYQGGGLGGIIVVEPRNTPEGLWSYIAHAGTSAVTGAEASPQNTPPLVDLRLVSVDSVVLPADCKG